MPFDIKYSSYCIFLRFWKEMFKARLHDAIFAYDCCMQLADAIPATLCHLSRRYDYCMRLFQPRDIL